MAEAPRVSVIMPAYNAEAFVEEAVNSLLAQTYPDWELVVVDDGSTDRTPQILQDFAAKDKRIRPIRMPRNSGQSEAQNQAIRAARGRYLAFLDSDDIWFPHKLERQLAVIEDSQHALCCASYALMSHEGAPIGKVRKVKPRAYTWSDLMHKNVIGSLTVMIDTHKTGPVVLAKDIIRAEDYALWLQLLRPGRTVIGVPEVLASYRLTRNSRSANKLRAAQGVWQMFRKSEKLSLPKAGWYFGVYAMRNAHRLFERL